MRYATKLSELAIARDFFAEELEGLSPADQVFLSVWTFYMEFYNGGFWQYFANSSGRLVPSLVGSLRTIGAGDVAMIAQEAIDNVGKGVVWENKDERPSRIFGLPEDIRKR